MKNIRKNEGFTLIELLIVVAIIGIIAAIAIPGLLRARMSGNEASAIGSLRAINSAQATYASSCAAGFYAPTLADLSNPPATNVGGEGFISKDLATDPVTKSGYTITMTAGAVTAPAVAACSTGNPTAVMTYYVGGDPATFGSTGTRYFGTNQGGTLYQGTAALAVTQVGQPAASTPIQ